MGEARNFKFGTHIDHVILTYF